MNLGTKTLEENDKFEPNCVDDWGVSDDTEDMKPEVERSYNDSDNNNNDTTNVSNINVSNESTLSGGVTAKTSETITQSDSPSKDDLKERVKTIKSPDQVFPNRRPKIRYFDFNDAQVGMIFDILKSNSKNTNVFFHNEGQNEGTLLNSTQKNYVFGLNRDTGELMNVHTVAYNNDASYYNNPMSEIYESTNESRDIVSANQYRCILRTAVYSNVNASEETLRMLSRIASLVARIPNRLKLLLKSENNIKNVNLSGKFYKTVGLLKNYIKTISYQKIPKHVGIKALVPNICTGLKYKYKIVQIPKEIQRKFIKLGKYFDEVKGMLKYNPQNGFYSYELEGLLIPIVCKHEFMYLEGVAPAEVSIECYKDGLCKYCGQEINAYHERINEEMPSKVYDLIYKFIKSISDNVEGDSLAIIFYNMIYKVVTTNIKNTSAKGYEAGVIALAALFLYKVYLVTKGNIVFSPKINKFLDNVMEYCASVGWGKDKMDTLVKSEALFAGIDNIVGIIKGKIYTNDIKFVNGLPISVLFEKPVFPNDFKNLKAENAEQKLYLSGVENMIKFNKLIEKKNLEKWDFRLSVKVMKDGSMKTKAKTKDIEVEVAKHGEVFFDKIWKSYCPKNGVHEFAGGTKGSVCKYCGILKDGSNKKDVYIEWEAVINNTYVSKPNMLPENKFKIDKCWDIKDVQKYDPDRLWDTYLNIKNQNEKTSLETTMKEGKKINEALKLISTLTTFDVEAIKKLGTSGSDVMKWFCFIVDKGIKTSEEMLNEIEFIYLPIGNVKLLFV